MHKIVGLQAPDGRGRRVFRGICLVGLLHGCIGLVELQQDDQPKAERVRVKELSSEPEHIEAVRDDDAAEFGIFCQRGLSDHGAVDEAL